MALVLPDRVRETSTTTGTGTVTLAGAVFGFQSFSAVGNGNSTYYCIANQSADEWEVGIGTYTSSGTTLSRTTVLSSSNAGSLVNFSAGTKDVFVTYPAERGVWRDTADTYVVQGSFDNLTAASASFTTGTISTTPSGSTDLVNKQYVDTVYTAGTGLTLSGTQFSITNTGVTATTYGSASQVPVITVNAQGQATSISNTTIAISSSAVSGLAASATVDTTNATNITSGTLPTGRLSGDYSGITGVGSITSGTWTATAIGVPYGGTGLSSYTTGDLIYAAAGTTLATLADVATGNALISGGVGAAPSWGKIGLTTHVSGTLSVSNGGTGATTLTGYVKGNGTSALTASATIPNSDTTATSANTANAIVARDASGNFSAGTITASLAGTANYATSAGSATVATYVGSGVTFNNGGAGDASGTFFDGSAPKTVSYNTIGAPSTTGANASGTWNISISGNAATATSATSAGTANSVSNAVTFSNLGSGAVPGTSYNGSSITTISYNTIGAPSTTGANASGTWGISITGSSGSVTNAVTFNNSGSGDASGTTFNGTAARTISYNTIGAISGSSPAITTPTITGTREVRVAVGASNLDLATGNYFSKTISGTTTFTVSNVPTTGTAQSLILDLTNGGSATINWWSGMKWPGGTAPTLTSSGRDVLGFFTYDGGTTWTGLILGKDVK